jgi:hypothetical protein
MVGNCLMRPLMAAGTYCDCTHNTDARVFSPVFSLEIPMLVSLSHKRVIDQMGARRVLRKTLVPHKTVNNFKVSV